MTNRRVVMMALAASLGYGLTASAQTPTQTSLTELLKRSVRPVPTATVESAAPAASAPVTSPGMLFLPPRTTLNSCGPRPPRPV